MKHGNDWHELLCRELDKLYEKGGYDNGGDLNAQTLEAADTVMHALKSLVTYEAMENSGNSRVRSGNERRENRYGRDDGYRGRMYREGYGYADDDGDEYEMYHRRMMDRR